jgi:lysylphosphatidylglycerol synthetase-like protein (DUF2156 family)
MKKISKVLAIITIMLASFLLASPGVMAASCENSSAAELQKCLTKNPIVKDVQTIVNILSAAVGIVIIGSLIYAGIQYAAAGDNSQAVGAAKQRIINSFVALAAYIFLFAFVQWLVPGGVFG